MEGYDYEVVHMSRSGVMEQRAKPLGSFRVDSSKTKQVGVSLCKQSAVPLHTAAAMLNPHSVLFCLCVQLVPRTVRQLFRSLDRRKQKSHKRFTVRCSFVQIYNEQVPPLPTYPAVCCSSSSCTKRTDAHLVACLSVCLQVYDLFNATHLRKFGVGGSALGPGLRVRWSKSADAFYVENLFQHEVSDADEVSTTPALSQASADK